MGSLEKAEQQNFKNIVYLGLCFMVLFTSYYAGQNLMTQVYYQLGFGPLGKMCFFIILSTDSVSDQFGEVQSNLSQHFCMLMC